MPAGAVNVARPSRWGNPFTMREFGKVEAIRLFRGIVDGSWNPDLVGGYDDAMRLKIYGLRCEWLARLGGMPTERIRSELGWRKLACWCVPGPCHADVLIEIANR